MRPPTPEQQNVPHPRRRRGDRAGLPRVLAARGEMAARIGAYDWSQTPLGRLEAWPVGLRSVTELVLEGRFPMNLLWGPELRHIYNDSYVPVLGGKHPGALGQPAREVWAEIWPIVEPQFDYVLAGNGASWNEHLLLPIDRKGFLEESYFTFSFSPVREDGGAIGGILATCQETTVQVQDERQLQMLRNLGTEALEAESVEGACQTAARILGQNNADLPFALIYVVRPGAAEAELIAAAGMDGYVGPGNPRRVPWRVGNGASWPLAAARAPGAFVVVDDLRARFGRMPAGRWDRPPEQAVVLALAAPGQPEPYGFLVAGANPMRALDERHRRMFQLTADQIVSALSAARAFEEEHTRVEALAALDRAKTNFFSNVSHEFRTPLTLMLGPTEDLLDGVHGGLSAAQRAQLELVHRNANRLHKLVNSLLEITRLETGRLQAAYEPVDLAALTRNLAGSFRAAVERAGVTFRIDCPPLTEPIFVDRDMWEKIVLNLVSNALKYTFEGTIEVSLRQTDGSVELRVSDTGIGIAPEHVPHIYDRFRRVEGARARTIEGSGIGLALVQELVKLHKGQISVETAVERGTTFTVTLARGASHLPAERISAPRTLASTALGAARFVDEAMGWFKDGTGRPVAARGAATEQGEAQPGRKHTARILVAEDNPDMRDYLQRLLEPQWSVEVVGDGPQALASVEAHPPDLLLTDVMMPGMDGFQLLQRLRADDRTRAIPVIMLSARAGEEARVEGLQAGADDYLTKPFSARELMARVETQLKLARLRIGVEQERERFYALLEQAPVPITVYEGAELRIVYQNRAAWMLTDGVTTVGKTVAEALPLGGDGANVQLLRQVYETGQGTIAPATTVLIPDPQGVREERIFDLLRQPLRDEAGRIIGVISVAFEITGQVLARREVEKSEARFRTIFETAEVSIWEEDLSAVKRMLDDLRAEHGPNLRAVLKARPDLLGRIISLIRIIDVNPATLRLLGASSKAELLASFGRLLGPEAADALCDEMVAIAQGARLFAANGSMRTLTGELVDVAFTQAVAPGDEAYERVFITLTDLSSRRLAEREREARIEEMERAVRFGEMFAGIVGHDLRNPLSAITLCANAIAGRAESEKSVRQARQAASSARRMEGMIGQLLDFTRIRLGGGLPVERTHVALPEVARLIIEELEPVYQRQIHLRSAGDVSGNWDHDRLSQMLSNLAANACQHGIPGTPIDLTLDGTGAPGVVRIEVHNKGVIPEELLPGIFEPLRSTTDRGARRGSTSGLGLGLYITQQIVLAHGGTIRVESTEAAGTRFVVELPRPERSGR